MDEIRHFFTLLEPSDQEIGRIVKLVTDLGGLEYAREKADRFAAAALEALDGLPAGAALDALRASVAYATQRNR
jgi:octaprenyl-diphosphate synthase